MHFAIACLLFGPAAQPAAGYKALPWHLAQIYWHLDTFETIQRVDVDSFVYDEPAMPANATRWGLFVVPLGGYIDGQPYYFGQMARSLGYLVGQASGGALVYDGSPEFVYSRWGDMLPESIRQPEPRRYDLSNHEGSLARVMRAKPWGVGRYTFTLQTEEPAAGAEHLWTSAEVLSHADGVTTRLGALRRPNTGDRREHALSAFVEIYGYPPSPTEFPKFRVAFGNLRINGQPAKVRHVSVRFPEGVPQVAEVYSARQFQGGVGFPTPGGRPDSPETVGIDLRSRPLDRKPGLEMSWPTQVPSLLDLLFTPRPPGAGTSQSPPPR
jgi:hypothetical protein